MKIFKYPLKITTQQEIEVPMSAWILSVDAQSDQLCLWAAVDPEETSMRKIKILVIGTGNPIPIDAFVGAAFIGTAKMYNGQEMWHVFYNMAS